MSEVKQFHLREGTLVEGKSLGYLNVYLASDYDQLKAELEATVKESLPAGKAQMARDSAELRRLCAERDRLKESHKYLSDAIERGLAEDLKLRTQLDEARELLSGASELIEEQAFHINQPMTDFGREFIERLESWLERKP